MLWSISELTILVSGSFEEIVAFFFVKEMRKLSNGFP
jgi:hypothetical protein